MNWVPGWDSAEAAGWWSAAWFWASMASLLMLGISEVASHRYSMRKDELSAAHQGELQRQNDKEIANLHLQTAQANERAARAELALEQYRAPRAISDADVPKIRALLEPFSGIRLELFVTGQTAELDNLQRMIVGVLRQSGWHVQSWVLMGGVAATGTVVIIKPGADERVMNAAHALVASLNEAGVISSVISVPPWWQGNWGASPGLLSGSPWSTGGDHAPIRLMIGTKN